MIREIINENMKYWNMNQKELAFKSRLSSQLISEILSGKRTLTPKTSRKLEIAFDLPAWSLLNTQTKIEEMEERKKDDGINKISDFLEKIDKFKLYSKESLLKIASKKIKSNKLEDRKEDLSQSVIGFRKYKDKPLAYLWISILENKYSNRKIENSFKKSSGKSVIKGTLDIMINTGDIDKRIRKLAKHLEKHGIILINAPFIPNSTIMGVCFKRNTQRFIFMSDMKKREYSYIFTLIHELMHYYFDLEDKIDDNEAANLIRNYLKKYNKNHKELELAMDTFENDRSIKGWNKLRENTNLKINFGDYKTLLV